MGCILYPPVTLVNPVHRLQRLQQRRRPACTTQQPLFTRAACNCLSTSRSSSCRWRAFFHQLSPTLPTTVDHQTTPTSRTAQQTPTRTITTTTAPTTSEKTTNPRRKQKSTLPGKRKPKKMERVIAVPSVVLSISVLVLGAAIGSSTSNCGGGHAPAPPSGTLGALLGRGDALGLGLNLSTLVPLLTLAWHAFTLLARARADRVASAYRTLGPASPSAFSFSSTAAEDDDEPALPAGGWAPHALVAAWALNTLLLLLVPRWTAATALPHAALAVLSALEASVLALAGLLARHHAQLALAGDTDDEHGWEHVDAAADRDADDDDDEMKLAEI